MKRLLTDIVLRSAEPPSSGRLELSDTRCVGLAFRVTSNGNRSWSFRFRDPVTNKTSRMGLGNYPDVSLGQAREKAEAMRKSVAAGSNPVEAKRQAREDATTKTFEALTDRYLQEYAYRFKRSAKADEANLRRHVLPKWGKRPYQSIQRRDVIELLEGLLAQGLTGQTNRVQSLVSKVFSFALDNDLISHHPCLRLKKRAPENAKTRVLTYGEIRLFWSSVVNPPLTRRTGLGLRLALLTGLRISAIAGLRRDELHSLDDPEQACLVIPPERMKQSAVGPQRSFLVPLSPLALETVQSILATVGDDELFLFPSPRRVNGRVPIEGHAFSVALDRLGKEITAQKDKSQVHAKWAEDPPTPHDLRRTLATRLGSYGVRDEDVSAVLDHTVKGVTRRHYNLYDRQREKREALDLWSANLQTLLTSKAEIIAFKRAG
ncbi:integrase arm-type DNA-binding domain-containing protein [Microvirga sp. ACRRW]|uniref:tyrosine-type recombinase/integrase n=1 Tax=Microvirga sp. ACRRW TaxID=2918205 RepID=UPI001EF4EBCA|nr:site-specific integrase [Microvirga sp. ACRRW]MCG7392663.1 integrase arm-type DNA-binding domain-containing protein [Microvirga sp. ACRRW]